MPKVMAAAINPKTICRAPEYQKFFPVKSVMAAPIRNKPTVLKMTLAAMAVVPVVKINGTTGIIPPIVNIKNE